jgi:hypothetical protein
MFSMRELTNMELDEVCGGWGFSQTIVNVSSQKNVQVAKSSGIVSINPATNIAFQQNNLFNTNIA